MDNFNCEIDEFLYLRDNNVMAQGPQVVWYSTILPFSKCQFRDARVAV